MYLSESGEDSHAVNQTTKYMYAKDGESSTTFQNDDPCFIGVTKMGATCGAIARIKQNMLSI